MLQPKFFQPLHGKVKIVLREIVPGGKNFIAEIGAGGLQNGGEPLAPGH